MRRPSVCPVEVEPGMPSSYLTPDGRTICARQTFNGERNCGRHPVSGWRDVYSGSVS